VNDLAATPLEQHFSGTNTRMLMEFLRDDAPPGTLEAVLVAAGESRSAEELSDDGTWSSYSQWRALLEAAGAALGGPEALQRVAGDASLGAGSPEFTEMLQALGSPSVLFREVAQSTGAGMTTVSVVESEEVGPTEWVMRQTFAAGLEPFPEYCSWSAGLWELTPRLFGYTVVDVVEEACMLHGAPSCEFRVRWDEADDATRRAEYLETRTQILESRLEALQLIMAEVVSVSDVPSILSKIVVSASRAVRAPAYVLAVESELVSRERVFAVGLSDADAAIRAEEMLARRYQPDDESCVVVEIASTHRFYGLLGAFNPLGRFLPQERGILETYGRLAAAALDSATSLEEAQREANTAQVLLELSSALAEIISVDEVAARLARAVPAVIDCDRSLVILFDLGLRNGRVAASFGYDPGMETDLRALVIDGTLGGAPEGVLFHGVDTSDPMIVSLQAKSDSVGSLTVPIVADGELVGQVVATATRDPQRLSTDPQVAARLRGFAAQAATAVRNARLLDRIRHQALHDALTGLPNRALIHDRVEQMLARSRRNRTPCAALFIDLDGFKNVNDTLGHDAGDLLLQSVAARLATVLRDSDTVGRLGGDEFIVLVEGASLDAGPELVAERLLDVLREPFVVANRETPLRVTASVGIAVGDRISPSELLRDADIALYSAKAAGKDRYSLFLPEMHRVLQDRMTLETDLSAAIADEQFFLVYQPIFDLRDGFITGVEALIRWNHPTRGLLFPEEFVPLLESSGMIVEVGRWVLDEACTQIASMHANGYPIDISVNVSVRQLERDEFPDVVDQIITRCGLDPRSLIIEITETAIMRDADGIARRLHALKALGVRVAIDDFGTGYSSLSFLRQFPVDALKIDGSFISAIANSAEAGALIHTLVQLGKALGLETVAEGIEDDAQYSYLQQEECDSGQGFLVAEPLDVAGLEHFLDHQTIQARVAVPATSP
jgi:diguanylate cyclase (GGDEF)-like protein